MSSRATIVQGQKSRGVGKQKDGQAEAKNRRALRDIGNLGPAPAADGKPQITRPITRNLRAQLLVDGRKPAEKYRKKPVAEEAEGDIKKNAVEPNSDEVIVISSDDDEVNCREEILKSGSGLRSDSSSKKTSRRSGRRTFTSTLAARSKVACGLAIKPKDVIVDIDAEDINNELAVVEYVDDMYKFYKETEEDGRVHDYMKLQPNITAKMRAILVDWLIEVHRKFELMPESLYLAVNVMDRYLSMKAISKCELQLVGMGSMLVACKYEEIWAPEVNDLITISNNAYVRDQLLLMEKQILRKLEWYLTVTTPYVFLVRYIKASLPYDLEVENMVFFYAELGLGSYSTMLCCPSMLAASAVYAARCTLNKTPFWTETLKHQTSYSEDQIIDCARLLASFHSQCSAAENKLRAAYGKYSNPERGVVALLPPAKSLLSVEASS